MKQLLGGILIAVGILIAGASGLCSMVALFGMGNGANILPLVLLIGGIPLAVGVGLIFGGRALIRRARLENVDVAEVAKESSESGTVD